MSFTIFLACVSALRLMNWPTNICSFSVSTKSSETNDRTLHTSKCILKKRRKYCKASGYLEESARQMIGRARLQGIIINELMKINENEKPLTFSHWNYETVRVSNVIKLSNVINNNLLRADAVVDYYFFHPSIPSTVWSQLPYTRTYVRARKNCSIHCHSSR